MRKPYTFYIDVSALKALQAHEKAVGVPVSESIRRSIAAYLKTLKKKS